MILEQMRQALGLSQTPACFDALYAQTAHTWEAHAARILSDAFISKTLTACYVLAPYRDRILATAALTGMPWLLPTARPGKFLPDATPTIPTKLSSAAPGLCRWTCVGF